MAMSSQGSFWLVRLWVILALAVFCTAREPSGRFPVLSEMKPGR